MYVKDHMIKSPITITKDVSISKALDIMKQGGFHRLPVVDEKGMLIGLVTENLVTESTNKNATSLDIYELNYLLSRMMVEEIMVKDVVVCSPDIFLEEAAALMNNKNVSVLPVVEEDRVVGIITEKDMFASFVEMMGFYHQGTKFVFPCEDKPGEFAKVVNLFAEHDANLESIAVYHSEERGAEVVLKATGEIPVEDMMEVLKENHIEVRSVIQTSHDGETIVWK